MTLFWFIIYTISVLSIGTMLGVFLMARLNIGSDADDMLEWRIGEDEE